MAGARSVVRMLNWKEPAAGRYVRLPGWADVAFFETVEEALADRARREDETRAVANPFACGGSFFELSTLPAPVLYDWLLDGGLEPPAPEEPLAEWARWWDAARPAMSPEQVTRAWAGLDKLRFYEVGEPVGPGTVWVVVEVHWDIRQDWIEALAAFEGGRPTCAFRSAEVAEAVREGTAGELSARVIDQLYIPRLTVAGARAQAGRDPFSNPVWDPERYLTIEDAPFAHVFTTPVTGDRTATATTTQVYLVQRLSWSWETRGSDLRWLPPPSERRVVGVPVAAFLTRREAEAFAWELDFVSRLYLNPFRFGHPRYLSSVAETGFRSVLGDLGLDLPADDWAGEYPGVSGLGRPGPWEAWWAATASGMSAAQRDAVWDLLDQLRFHEVVEVPLEG